MDEAQTSASKGGIATRQECSLAPFPAYLLRSLLENPWKSAGTSLGNELSAFFGNQGEIAVRFA